MARGRRSKGDDVMLKSAEMIGWAIGGIEREIAQTRERLATLTEQAARLRARTAGRVRSAVEEARETGLPGKRKRRKMSAEAKKRISDMMKKRWAERKRGK